MPAEDRKMIYHYDNTPIFYEISGNGPAVVLLHGFLESTSMWGSIIEEFKDKRTIISIDLPGHGQSGVISDTHSMELMATVVLGILQEHDFESVAVIGHSMGGYVALAMAEKHPNLVSKLILLNSTPAADSPERKVNRDRALKVIKTNREAFISMAITNLFTEHSQNEFAEEIAQLKREALSFPSEGVTAAIRGMRDRKDRSLVLKNYTGEKYMICATEDPIVPFQASEVLAKFTKTPVKKVSGGHMSLTENYQETIKILHLIG